MVHKASINIEADEKVRLHVRTMLEKLSAHLLAERVASVSPGPRISDKREGATPLGSGAGGKGQDTPQHGVSIGYALMAGLARDTDDLQPNLPQNLTLATHGTARPRL